MQAFCCGQCLRAESRGSPGVCLGKQERDGGHSIVPVPSSPLSSAPVEGDFYFYCFYCLKRAQLGLSTIRLFLGSSGSPAGCSLGWGWGLILFKSTFLQNLGQAQPRGGPQQENSSPRSSPGGKAKPHGALGCSQLLNLEFSSGLPRGPAQHLFKTTRLGSSHQCAGSAILTGNPRGPRSPFSPWMPFSPFAPSSPASPCREGRWARSQKSMAQTTHPCILRSWRQGWVVGSRADRGGTRWRWLIQGWLAGDSRNH